jgi:hypothetical protein
MRSLIIDKVFKKLEYVLQVEDGKWCRSRNTFRFLISTHWLHAHCPFRDGIAHDVFMLPWAFVKLAGLYYVRYGLPASSRTAPFIFAG